MNPLVQPVGKRVVVMVNQPFDRSIFQGPAANTSGKTEKYVMRPGGLLRLRGQGGQAMITEGIANG